MMKLEKNVHEALLEGRDSANERNNQENQKNILQNPPSLNDNDQKDDKNVLKLIDVSEILVVDEDQNEK